MERNDEALSVTISARVTPEMAARIAEEAKRRSSLAGVPIKPTSVVRVLLEEALGAQPQMA
jgi:hypothetical protein